MSAARRMCSGWLTEGERRDALQFGGPKWAPGELEAAIEHDANVLLRQGRTLEDLGRIFGGEWEFVDEVTP